MRRCRSALTVLTLTLMSLLIAAPATAGGPTSVLLVDPGTGETASLYADDADYEALALMVGAFEPNGAPGKVDRSGASHESGPGVTVTWLIHDVQVWRVDRIFADAEGGPWISTQLNLDDKVFWHRAADGQALTALLDRLVLDPVGVEPDPAVVSPEAALPVEQSADVGTSSTGGLMWGLLLGVTLSMLAMRLWRLFRPGTGSGSETAHDDPLDVQVVEADPERKVDWAQADKLAWPAKSS